MIFESTTGKDAIDLLEADHREVEALFREFESADDDARKVELAAKICGELVIHATIEERIFYPAARQALSEDKEDLVSEATVEHASLKDLIAAIDGSSPREELFEAQVKVLGEYVKHHVREEETELMPAVRRTNVDLDAIGERLAALKESLKESQQQRPARGASNRVRVPMPAKKRAGRSRKSAPAKASRRKSRGTRRKNGSRSRNAGVRKSASNARGRTSASRKRVAARKQGGRSARNR